MSPINGPGVWSCIHMEAFQAREYNDKFRFFQSLNAKFKALDCAMCQNNIPKHLSKCHPLHSKYWDFNHPKYGRIGMFLWSVDFHNLVNEMLNKPKMDLDVAYDKYNKIYLGQSDCQECQIKI